MALSDVSNVDRVLLQMGFGGVRTYRVYNGDYTVASNLVDRGNYQDFLDTNNANRNQLIARVAAGTCDIYYRLGNTIWIEADLPDALQIFRFSHPLHGGTGWQTPRHLIDGATVSVDADTGRPSIDLGGDFAATRRTPSGDTYTQSLLGWRIEPANTSDRFRLHLDLDEGLELTSSDINDQPVIEAMLVWLETKRTFGGFAVGDDILGSHAGRHFSVEQNNSETVIFAITGAGTGTLDGHITDVTLTCEEQTGSASRDLEDFQGVLSEATAAVTTQTGIEVPPLGEGRCTVHRQRVENQGRTAIVLPLGWSLL